MNDLDIIRALDGFFMGQDVEGVPRFIDIKAAYLMVTKNEGLYSNNWPVILGSALERRMVVEYKAFNHSKWQQYVTKIVQIADFRTTVKLRSVSIAEDHILELDYSRPHSGKYLVRLNNMLDNDTSYIKSLPKNMASNAFDTLTQTVKIASLQGKNIELGFLKDNEEPSLDRTIINSDRHPTIIYSLQHIYGLYTYRSDIGGV